MPTKQTYDPRVQELLDGAKRRRGFGVAKDRSIFGAYKELGSREKNTLLKTIDVLASGQYFLAGAARGVKQGSGDIWQSGLRGVAERTSFSTITGDPWSGFAFDVLFDPVNLLSGGALAKVGGKGGRALIKAMRMNPKLTRVVDLVGSNHVQNYLLKRDDYNGFVKLKNAWLGRLNFARSTSLNKYSKEIVDLVPDATERRQIGYLIDSEPVMAKHALREMRGDAGKGMTPFFELPENRRVPLKELRDSDEWKYWKKKFDSMTGDQQEAFGIARKALSELESLKIGAKLLTAERAAGYIVKAGGRNYAPRYYYTKENAISHIQDKRASLQKMFDQPGKRLSKKARKKIVDDMNEFDDQLSVLADMPDVIGSTFHQRIRKTIPTSEVSHFAQEAEYGHLPYEKLPQKLREALETDIAKTLDLESREVARAIANQQFYRTAVRYLRMNGLMLPESLKGKGAKVVLREMQEAGIPVNRKMLKEELDIVKVQGMSNFLVPKSIANEVNAVMKSYTGTAHMDKVTNAWAGATRWWKAFTLMPFPSYHLRNRLGNIWNMTFDMDKGVADYLTHHRPATELVHAAKHGDIGEGMVEYAGRKYSRKDLVDGMLHERVISGGEFAGEVGSVMDNSRDYFMGALFDPKRNIVTRTGYRLGRHIEDGDRATYFLYRLSKGDTFAEAGTQVRKRLFDYEHGLTPFESKWLRNGLVPFWAWTKFNLPYQLEMLAAHPQRFVRYKKGLAAYEDVAGGPQPDETYLAEWMKKAVNFRMKWDEKSNTYSYFVLDSWWPAADIGKFTSTRAGQEFLNMIHPGAKLPFELLSNYSFFSGKKIQRAGHQGQLLGMEKVLNKAGIGLDKRVEHLLRSARVINEADRVIMTMVKEYGGVSPKSFAYAGLRALFGKTYPTNMQDQIRLWDYVTGKQLGELTGARRAAEKYGGDRYNIKAIDRQIKELTDLREKHLKLPQVRRALKKTRRR